MPNPVSPAREAAPRKHHGKQPRCRPGCKQHRSAVGATQQSSSMVVRLWRPSHQHQRVLRRSPIISVKAPVIGKAMMPTVPADGALVRAAHIQRDARPTMILECFTCALNEH
eukprot:1336844-Prymnesium_polylepis.2